MFCSQAKAGLDRPPVHEDIRGGNAFMQRGTGQIGIFVEEKMVESLAGLTRQNDMGLRGPTVGRRGCAIRGNHRLAAPVLDA